MGFLYRVKEHPTLLEKHFSKLTEKCYRDESLHLLAFDLIYCCMISKDIRWHLRDALDQMNINERMIYPGLDGVAGVEGRHYYVRDESKH